MYKVKEKILLCKFFLLILEIIITFVYYFIYSLLGMETFLEQQVNNFGHTCMRPKTNAATKFQSNKCTEMEKKLAEQCGTDITVLHKSIAGTEPLSGVAYDEHGIPIGSTVPEWFDELDQKLIDYFGETYRGLANERRTRWNKQETWKFDRL
jgi:hypothetical protein